MVRWTHRIVMSEGRYYFRGPLLGSSDNVPVLQFVRELETPRPIFDSGLAAMLVRRSVLPESKPRSMHFLPVRGDGETNVHPAGKDERQNTRKEKRNPPKNTVLQPSKPDIVRTPGGHCQIFEGWRPDFEKPPSKCRRGAVKQTAGTVEFFKVDRQICEGPVKMPAGVMVFWADIRGSFSLGVLRRIYCVTHVASETIRALTVGAKLAPSPVGAMPPPRAPGPSSGASSSGGTGVLASSQDSGGTGVFASSQDTVRLASYNIGAQNENSFQGKLNERFRQHFATDLDILVQNADVICIQEISPDWSQFMEEHTGWKTLSMDKKAICWGPGVELIWSQWQRVFPEANCGEGRKHRGILWARRSSNVDIFIARFCIRVCFCARRFHEVVLSLARSDRIPKRIAAP